MEGMYIHFREYLRWYVLLCLLGVSFILWSMVLDEKNSGTLTFAVIDVGQGDSLFIKSPTGKQIIVDGGPNNALLKQIQNFIPFFDRDIDMLVVTNPDTDHYEGFIKLLDKYNVTIVLEPGTTNSFSAYKVLEDKIKEKNIKKVLARKGQVIDIGGGAYLQVLFPDRDVSGLSSNDGSIVMKLVYGDTSVMLQGDSTSRIEHYLLSSVSTTTLKSDILKAGHHGSRTSTYVGYVKAVNPKWTVISSGKNNDYGHPHKETLETLNKLSIPAYDTCNNGNIVFISDGKEFSLKNKNILVAKTGCEIN